MVQPFWETVWQFLRKLNIFLLYNLAIALFVFPSKEVKAYPHKNLYMMFIAVAKLGGNQDVLQWLNG